MTPNIITDPSSLSSSSLLSVQHDTHTNDFTYASRVLVTTYPVVICACCGKIFGTQQKLDDHLAHQLIQGQCRTQCIHCRFIFESRTQLFDHIKKQQVKGECRHSHHRHHHHKKNKMSSHSSQSSCSSTSSSVVEKTHLSRATSSDESKLSACSTNSANIKTTRTGKDNDEMMNASSSTISTTTSTITIDTTTNTRNDDADTCGITFESEEDLLAYLEIGKEATKSSSASSSLKRNEYMSLSFFDDEIQPSKNLRSNNEMKLKPFFATTATSTCDDGIAFNSEQDLLAYLAKEQEQEYPTKYGTKPSLSSSSSSLSSSNGKKYMPVPFFDDEIQPSKHLLLPEQERELKPFFATTETSKCDDGITFNSEKDLLAYLEKQGSNSSILGRKECQHNNSRKSKVVVTFNEDEIMQQQRSTKNSSTAKQQSRCGTDDHDDGGITFESESDLLAYLEKTTAPQQRQQSSSEGKEEKKCQNKYDDDDDGRTSLESENDLRSYLEKQKQSTGEDEDLIFQQLLHNPPSPIIDYNGECSITTSHDNEKWLPPPPPQQQKDHIYQQLLSTLLSTTAYKCNNNTNGHQQQQQQQEQHLSSSSSSSSLPPSSLSHQYRPLLASHYNNCSSYSTIAAAAPSPPVAPPPGFKCQTNDNKGGPQNWNNSIVTNATLSSSSLSEYCHRENACNNFLLETKFPGAATSGNIMFNGIFAAPHVGVGAAGATTITSSPWES